MKLLLHCKKFSREISRQIIDFVDNLTKSDHDIFFTKKFSEEINRQTSKYNLSVINNVGISHSKKKFDFLICFGGDGTILDATTIVQKTEIPIVGINIGRLGFLATISKDEISSLMNHLENKNYSLSRRTLIEIYGGNSEIDFPYSLNEISVSSKENSSMINIKVFLNNNYLNTYWADGLIVSTPTGSTGYSLSCGGPIVMPKSNNFIITPIAPHNLNVRPLVISDKNIIRLEIIESKTRKFLLSMDSRNYYVKQASCITIKKADYKINLLELKNSTYSKTIREKLLWGLDTRNY